MTRTLTLRQLVKAGACIDQRRQFKALFGASVEVTEELAHLHALDFDWSWAAQHLLSDASFANYWRARTDALANYKRARKKALADYMRVRVDALADYTRASEDALADYMPILAVTWARLYILEGQS